jgi:uncharacterized SAM-binding protein YcdF (DUF218 family)
MPTMSRRLLELLLLPPLLAFALYGVGAALGRRRPRLGRILRASALLLLWGTATPACGGALLTALQTHPPLPAAGPLPAADAIVVLAAEADLVGAEFGRPVVGALTLQRLRYAVELHRRTGLPILTCGGAPAAGLPPLAELMAQAASEEFGVAVRWRETRSFDTFENAAFGAELLAAAGVRRAFVVTHAWHVPRALQSFARTSVEPIAAPTAFRGPAIADWTSFLPHWTGMKDTSLGLHEALGALYYALR